jgi:hypothetical protein
MAVGLSLSNFPLVSLSVVLSSNFFLQSQVEEDRMALMMSEW